MSTGAEAGLRAGAEDSLRAAADGRGPAAEFSWAVMTPDATVASGRCELLIVPAADGEMGILAGHAALIACVVPGELRVTASGATRRLSVGAGVVEVRGEEVRLLVTDASA